MKKEPRRKWGIPPVGSGNASVVNDSLTRCGSILFRRNKKRPSEKREIRPTFLWLPSVFAFTIDLPMTLCFLPFSLIHFSCIVSSHLRVSSRRNFVRISLSLSLRAHHLKYSALFSPQLPLSGSHAASSNTFRGKGA